MVTTDTALGDTRQGNQAEQDSEREERREDEALQDSAGPQRPAFNPSRYLINLPGRGGNTDYLEGGV